MESSAPLPGPLPTSVPSERRPGLGRLVLGWLLILLSLPVFAWGLWSGWAAIWGPAERLESYRSAKVKMILDSNSQPIEKRIHAFEQQEAELRGKVSGFRTTEAMKAFGVLVGGAFMVSYGLELRRRKPSGPAAGAGATEAGGSTDGPSER